MALSIDEEFDRLTGQKSSATATQPAMDIDAAYDELLTHGPLAHLKYNVGGIPQRTENGAYDTSDPYYQTMVLPENEHIEQQQRMFQRGDDLGNSFVSGLYGGAGNLVDAGGYIAGSLPFSNSSNWRDSIYGVSDQIGEAGAGYQNQISDPHDFLNRTVSGGASSLPPMLTSAALTGLSAFIPGVGGYAPQVMQTLMGGSEAAGSAGSLERKLLREGKLTPEQAKTAANRLFWTELPLDVASEKYLGMFGDGKGGVIRKMLGEGIQEAGQETHQGILQDAAEKSAGGSFGDFVGALGESVKKAPEIFMEEGLPAFVSGALMGGVAGANFRAKTDNITAPKINQQSRLEHGLQDILQNGPKTDEQQILQNNRQKVLDALNPQNGTAAPTFNPRENPLGDKPTGEAKPAKPVKPVFPDPATMQGGGIREGIIGHLPEATGKGLSDFFKPQPETLPGVLPTVGGTGTTGTTGTTPTQAPAPEPQTIPAPEPIQEPAPAPVPEPQTAPQPRRGLASEVVSPDGKYTAQTEFEVVPASSLIASNGMDFEMNPNYPAELQPRDRSRTASEMQINRITAELDPERLAESRLSSEGAPIIGKDNVVESGNGRTIAVQRGYRGNAQTLQNYKEWLANNAERFGLTREQVESIPDPILVRRRSSDVSMADRVAFAQASNRSSVQRLSPTEQAKVDAKNLSNDLLDAFDAENEILHSNNRNFIEGFINQITSPDERGELLDSNGRVTQSLLRRVKNALFYEAYGDERLSERMSESLDDNVKSVNSSLLQAAPRLAKLRRAIANGTTAERYAISNEISEAANKLSQLRQEGQKIDDFLNQTHMFDLGMSEEAKTLLKFFNDNKHRPKRITQALQYYAQSAEMLGDLDQQQFLGMEVEVPKAELLASAIRKADPDASFNKTRDSLLIGEKGARNIDAQDLVRGEGEKAIRIKNLDIAKEMQKKGIHPDKIWAATGWERGVDNKWRYEVKDFKTRKEIDRSSVKILPNAQSKRYPFKLSGVLGDFVEIPQEVLAAYPNLANFKVEMEYMQSNTYGWFSPSRQTVALNLTKFIVVDSKKRMSINNALQNGTPMHLSNDAIATIMHEIQHVIQNQEGFAPGTSPSHIHYTIERNRPRIEEYRSDANKNGVRSDLFDRFFDALRLAQNRQSELLNTRDFDEMRRLFSETKRFTDEAKQLEAKHPELQPVREKLKQYFEQERRYQRNISLYNGDGSAPSVIRNWSAYEATSGEVEARNVESRLDLSEEERRERRPEATESVNRPNQIVLNEEERTSPLETVRPERDMFNAEQLDDNKKGPSFQKNLEKTSDGLLIARNINDVVTVLKSDVATGTNFSKNTETGIIASYASRSINKLVSNRAQRKSRDNGFTGTDHFTAAANIKELFKNASLRETSPDKNNSPDVLSVKRFYAPFSSSQGPAEVKITVKEILSYGHKLYSVEVMEIQKTTEGKLEQTRHKTYPAPASVVDSTITEDSSNVKVNESSQNVEPYSPEDGDFFIGTPQNPKAPAGKAGKNLTKIHDIFEKLRTIAPVRKGLNERNRQVLGYYTPYTDVARTRYWGDYMTALHEVAHALDYKLQLRDDISLNEPMNSPIYKELCELGKNASPAETYQKYQNGDTQAAAYLMKEGIAEFFRAYAVVPQYAETMAPEYAKRFKDTLAKNAEFEPIVRDIFNTVRAYETQSPQQKVLASMEHNPTSRQRGLKGWISEHVPHSIAEAIDMGLKAGNETLRQWDDRGRPVEQIQNKLLKWAIKNKRDDMLVKDKSGRYHLKNEYAVYDMWRTAPGFMGKAQGDIDAIVSPVKGIHGEAYDLTAAYMKMGGALDYWNNGMEPGTGISRTEAEAEMAKIEREHPEVVERVEKILSAYEAMVRETMIDSGIWSPDTYEEWKKKYPHYIPFIRVDENGESHMPAKGGNQAFTNVSNGVKHRTGVGSERGFMATLDPMVAMLHNAQVYHKLAEKNRVARSLVEAVNTDPAMFNWLAEPIEGNEAEGKPTFWVWKDGKKQMYATDKGIYDALQTLSQVIPNGPFAKVASKVSGMLAMGATRLNPAFVFMTNFIKDSFTSSINSDSWAPPFYNTVRGLMIMNSSKPENLQLMQSASDNGIFYSGITESGLREDPKAIEKYLRKVIGDPSLIEHAQSAYDRAIGQFNEMIEVAPKIYEFQHLVKKGVPTREAARRAREVNIDFSRGGITAKNVNHYIAFFNPQVQGASKTMRTMIEHPAKTFTKIGLYAVLPAMLAWAASKDDDEYQKLSRDIRDRYFCFKVGDTWMRIPKPEGYGVFAALAERVLDHEYKTDPDAFRGFGHTVANGFAPSSYFPTIWGPIVEQMTNKSLFTGRDLVPRDLQKFPARMQYDKNTSSAARKIGELLDVSPIIVDNYISGYGAGMATTAVHLLDGPIDALEGRNAPPREAKKISEYPMLNRVTVDPDRSSEYLSRFWDLKDEAEKARNAFKEDAKNSKSPKADFETRAASLFETPSKELQKIRKSMTEIQSSYAYTPERKRQLLDHLRDKQNLIAQKTLEKYYKLRDKMQ